MKNAKIERAQAKVDKLYSDLNEAQKELYDLKYSFQGWTQEEVRLLGAAGFKSFNGGDMLHTYFTLSNHRGQGSTRIIRIHRGGRPVDHSSLEEALRACKDFLEREVVTCLDRLHRAQNALSPIEKALFNTREGEYSDG